eukprot:scaffold1534_cov267-Pinguiococcus_pyrenoidosus.AAC.15
MLYMRTAGLVSTVSSSPRARFKAASSFCKRASWPSTSSVLDSAAETRISAMRSSCRKRSEARRSRSSSRSALLSRIRSCRRCSRRCEPFSCNAKP